MQIAVSHAIQEVCGVQEQLPYHHLAGGDRTVTFHGPMEEDAGVAEAQSQQLVAAQVGNCLRELIITKNQMSNATPLLSTSTTTTLLSFSNYFTNPHYSSHI